MWNATRLPQNICKHTVSLHFSLLVFSSVTLILWPIRHSSLPLLSPSRHWEIPSLYINALDRFHIWRKLPHSNSILQGLQLLGSLWSRPATMMFPPLLPDATYAHSSTCESLGRMTALSFQSYLAVLNDNVLNCSSLNIGVEVSRLSLRSTLLHLGTRWTSMVVGICRLRALDGKRWYYQR